MEEHEEYGTAPRSTPLQEYVPLPRSTIYLGGVPLATLHLLLLRCPVIVARTFVPSPLRPPRRSFLLLRQHRPLAICKRSHSTLCFYWTHPAIWARPTLTRFVEQLLVQIISTVQSKLLFRRKLPYLIMQPNTLGRIRNSHWRLLLKMSSSSTVSRSPVSTLSKPMYKWRHILEVYSPTSTREPIE